MRILFVTDAIRPLPTGTGRMALAHLRALRAAGADVVPIDREHNPIAADAAGRDTVVIRPRLPILRTALWHLGLPRRIAAQRLAYDAAIDPSGYPCLFGIDRRWVLVAHDLSMYTQGLYRPGKRAWFRMFLGRSLRRAGAVVCVSQHTADAVRRRFALDEDLLQVVHNPIEATDPTPAAADLPPGIGSDDRRFALVLGTVERRKNAARILTAHRALSARTPPLDLVFAGRLGPGGGEALAAASSDHPAGRVRHIDSPDDATVRTLLEHARMLVFPSLDEGFGIPILEAFRARLPVLTSSVAAMPEVAGDAALLVDPTSAEQIAAGIERLDDDEALRARLVDAGQRRITVFSPDAIGERLLEVLTRAARRAAAMPS